MHQQHHGTDTKVKKSQEAAMLAAQVTQKVETGKTYEEAAGAGNISCKSPDHTIH